MGSRPLLVTLMQHLRAAGRFLAAAAAAAEWPPPLSAVAVVICVGIAAGGQHQAGDEGLFAGWAQAPSQGLGCRHQLQLTLVNCWGALRQRKQCTATTEAFPPHPSPPLPAPPLPAPPLPRPRPHPTSRLAPSLPLPVPALG